MSNQLDISVFIQEWSHPKVTSEQKQRLAAQLFNFQMERMQSLRYDLLMPQLDTRSVYRLRKMKKAVLERATVIRPGLLPFLPVIPRKIETTFDVVSRLYSDGENWEQAISLDKVDKGIKTGPHIIPYFVFGVDISFDTIGLSPNQSILLIGKRNMCPMNLAEILALQMHTNILEKVFIHACGSTYKKEGLIPGIDVDEKGHFQLVKNNADVAKTGWISPSYTSDMPAISWQGIINPKAWRVWRERPKKQRVIIPLRAD